MVWCWLDQGRRGLPPSVTGSYDEHPRTLPQKQSTRTISLSKREGSPGPGGRSGAMLEGGGGGGLAGVCLSVLQFPVEEPHTRACSAALFIDRTKGRHSENH